MIGQIRHSCSVVNIWYFSITYIQVKLVLHMCQAKTLFKVAT